MKRILIICAGLQYGGVERFAANIIKYAPENEFAFDYLIFDGLGDAFAPEIKAKGGRIISIPSPNTGYKSYIKRLGELIDENRYDVVHSHTQFNSGINLWVAKRHNVPIRIAHSHTTAHENHISIKQSVYENVMRLAAKKYATHLCACGIQAGKWMYGNHPFTVINNGVDTDLFAYSDADRAKIRKQYDIPDNAFIIGHSGTLSKLKNQELLIRMMPDILTRKENAVLILLGRGPEDFSTHLTRVANECDVANKVIFAGAVMNVNEHLSAFDVFAFPSLREGTPMALLEAQANGLPCILNDVIPGDAQITPLCHALPITNTQAWIETICNAQRDTTEKYRSLIEASGYGAKTAFEKLYAIYRNNDK